MGLPDFLKFASRSAPDSLVPLVAHAKGSPLSFDYALIDATNIAQTLGLDQLFDLFVGKSITVTKAIIFAVDSQRDRTGTARHHRLSRAVVGDLDVKVQELCLRLTKAFDGQEETPLVLMSGRGVAGEADYKILDIQRSIVSFSLYNETPIPTFLFISEDSDILCGTLCGPAPQNVCIATSLHDTTFTLHLLRLGYFMTYVAACVDALSQETSVESSEKVVSLPVAPLSTAASVEVPVSGVASQEDDGVVRRRKKDGPMTAAGVRETFSDSESDESPDNQPSEPVTEVAEAPASVALHSASTIVHPEIPSLDFAAAWICQSSCVDLVFLFQLIMGNGSTLPPLVRGVTKVDVQSCWSSYCRLKYTDQSGPNGRNIIYTSATSSNSEALIRVDYELLGAILESVHYTDTISRPPVGDEKARAIEFLWNAVYGTFRYIVGCNINCGNGATDVEETFLDSRPPPHSTPISPSLAAIRWVLSSTRTQEFTLHFQPEHDGDRKSKVRAAAGAEKIDVAANLLLPQRSASWAIRDSGPKTLSIESILRMKSVETRNMTKCTLGQKLKHFAQEARKNILHLPTEYKNGTGIFSALVTSWALLVASAVPDMRRIGSETRFVSPVTGKMVLGPIQSTLSSEKRRKRPMTYSFELRRMTPTIETGRTEAVLDSGADSREMLMKALGVSFDYASKPLLTPQETTESIPPPKKKKMEKMSVPSGASLGSVDAKPKKTRPGRKERLRRLAASKSELPDLQH